MDRVVIRPKSIGVAVEQPCVDQGLHVSVDAPVVAPERLGERTDAAWGRTMDVTQELEALGRHHRRKRRKVFERQVVLGIGVRDLPTLGTMPRIDELPAGITAKRLTLQEGVSMRRFLDQGIDGYTYLE